MKKEMPPGRIEINVFEPKSVFAIAMTRDEYQSGKCVDVRNDLKLRNP